MKDVELGLIAELLMDFQRSDRDLAKGIGGSQHVVKRTRMKLDRKVM